MTTKWHQFLAVTRSSHQQYFLLSIRLRVYFLHACTNAKLGLFGRDNKDTYVLFHRCELCNASWKTIFLGWICRTQDTDTFRDWWEVSESQARQRAEWVHQNWRCYKAAPLEHLPSGHRCAMADILRTTWCFRPDLQSSGFLIESSSPTKNATHVTTSEQKRH